MTLNELIDKLTLARIEKGTGDVPVMVYMLSEEEPLHQGEIDYIISIDNLISDRVDIEI